MASGLVSVSAGALARAPFRAFYRLEGVEVGLIYQIDRPDPSGWQTAFVDVTPHTDMRHTKLYGGFMDGHDFTFSHVGRIQNT